jgi:hypothetical protein
MKENLMRVSELLSVMEKIKKYYDQNNILNLYNSFIQSLTNILQQNQKNQELRATQEPLYKAFRNFRYDSLSYSEKQILVGYDSTNMVGSFAVKYLDQILRDQNFDPARVINDIKQHHKACSDLYKRANDTIAMLSPLVEKHDVELSKNHGILQLHFTNNTDFDDFVSFENWIDSWNIILRNAADLCQIRTEELKISLIEKNSPLLIEIGTIVGIINLIGSATLLILKNIDLQYNKDFETDSPIVTVLASAAPARTRANYGSRLKSLLY